MVDGTYKPFRVSPGTWESWAGGGQKGSHRWGCMGPQGLITRGGHYLPGDPLSSEDDGKETSATRAGNLARVRFLMFLTVVLVVAFMAVLIFGLASTVRWEAEWLVGGSTVDQEEFKPMDIRVLPYPYAAALDEANRQLEEMELGNISKVDPDSHEFEAHLILDYEAGSVMYWRFSDGDVEVDFDAYSGEIISYFRYTDSYIGNMTEEEVVDLVDRILEQFAPIPSDSIGPFAERVHRGSTLYAYENGSEEMVECYSWFVDYYRVVDGIVADDDIFVEITEDGTLGWYEKVWWMNLRDLDTSYTVTRDQAIGTALEEFGEDLTVVSCEKKVVRPNNAFGEQSYYGTPPLCVWEVTLEDGDEREIIADVHARKAGSIVGGEEHHWRS